MHFTYLDLFSCLTKAKKTQGSLCSSVGKQSAYNTGDLSSIPGLGRSPGEGNGNSLQYSLVKNPMDCRAPLSMGLQESDTT